MSENDNYRPLVVTAWLDNEAFTFFNASRKKHFPVARNVLDAHLTLFHALPGAEIETIGRALGQAVAGQSIMRGTAAGLRFLGGGVAYDIQCQALSALRHDLASGWASWLTRQDAQPLRPHVTIQNKADPAEARELHRALTQNFMPFAVTFTGLALWHYENGPWSLDTIYEFNGAHGKD